MKPISIVRALRPSAMLAMLAVPVLAVSLSGCSSVPPPVEQIAVSRTAVERASSSPNAVDAAPVDLQQARQKLERAQRAMTERDYVLARRMAEQADVDARVAESRASSARGERARSRKFRTASARFRTKSIVAHRADPICIPSLVKEFEDDHVDSYDNPG